MSYQYGLMKYRHSINLGDEIQGLAAKQYYPTTDVFIERDNWSEIKLNRPTKVIANGWYTHMSKNWPPKNPNILPLLISIHVRAESIPAFTSKDSVEYMNSMGGVGCRDFPTLEVLRNAGVENAYFSGCLTLTTPRRNRIRGHKIYAVDLPFDISPLIPKAHRERVEFLSHKYPKNMWFCDRVARKLGLPFYRFAYYWAERFLERYSSAAFVITTRLHCAMPCVALGIPVYFVPGNLNDPRFEGLSEFVHALPRDKFLRNPDFIQWDDDIPNPGDPAPLANALRERCHSFVEDDPVMT